MDTCFIFEDRWDESKGKLVRVKQLFQKAFLPTVRTCVCTWPSQKVVSTVDGKINLRLDFLQESVGSLPKAASTFTIINESALFFKKPYSFDAVQVYSNWRIACWI